MKLLLYDGKGLQRLQVSAGWILRDGLWLMQQCSPSLIMRLLAIRPNTQPREALLVRAITLRPLEVLQAREAARPHGSMGRWGLLLKGEPPAPVRARQLLMDTSAQDPEAEEYPPKTCQAILTTALCGAAQNCYPPLISDTGGLGARDFPSMSP